MSDLFTYTQARGAADCGMARALDTAERDNPDFGDHALEILTRLAATQQTVHIDDFLTATSLRPSSPNAMGAIWQRAAKRRIIERTGFTKPCETDVKKHAHQYPVYKSLIFQGVGEA